MRAASLLLRGGALGLGLVFAACAPGDDTPARVLAVRPAQGAMTATVAVDILGRDLHPRVETDFSAKTGSLDATFQAWLSPLDATGEDVALLDVRFLSDEHLSARVPAGLARGDYALRVREPSGAEAEGRLRYRVTPAPPPVAGFQVGMESVQHAGIPFPITVTAVDVQGQPVPDFQGTARLSARSGAVIPDSVGPFSQGRASALVTLALPTPQNRLCLEVTGGVTAESAPIDVRQAPAARVVWSNPTLSAEAGTCMGPATLEVRDAQGAVAAFDGPMLVAIRADPLDGVGLFTDATCTQALPAEGLSLTRSSQSLYVSVRHAGPLLLRARPAALPGDSQLHEVQPGVAAALAFTSPARVVVAGGCSSAVTVSTRDRLGNIHGPSAPIELGLSVPPASRLTLYSDPSCTTPSGPLVVSERAPSATVYFRAPVAGTWVIESAAPPASGLGHASQELRVEP
ncbi:hypothetical protein KRR26_19625 [Corallococcus sp. M34]|uniref:hypothetical protein n=1 Tax=Citreicoccus inhibens TaxID=2849499 RepID=UPI001C24FD61|nr:hypothetical protein [Citreicoccus inhibens]MBU8897831.1 hypothetical protein [Citreicoccus inhibens]